MQCILYVFCMLQWSIVRSEQNQLGLAPASKRQTGSVTSDQARCQCFSTQTVIRFRISMHPLSPPPPEKIARILFFHGQRGRKGLNETGDCCVATWIWVKLRIYVTKWPRLRPNFDVRKIQCGHFYTHTSFPPSPQLFLSMQYRPQKKEFNTCIFKSAGLRSPRRKGKRKKRMENLMFA